jgi:hypothetical protein
MLPKALISNQVQCPHHLCPARKKRSCARCGRLLRRHTQHITSSRALKSSQLQQPVAASSASSSLPSAVLSSRTPHARTPGQSPSALFRRTSARSCHVAHSGFPTATADVADLSGIHLSASSTTASSSDGRLLGAAASQSAAAQGQDHSAGLLNVEMLLRFVSARLYIASLACLGVARD